MERPSATTNGTEKFTGHFRHPETGNDYADQRYYGPGSGRFLMPDRYMASNGGPGNPSDPASWNHYAYTRADPINRTDSSGTCDSEDQSDCNPNFCVESGLCNPFGGSMGPWSSDTCTRAYCPDQGGGAGVPVQTPQPTPPSGAQYSGFNQAIVALSNDPKCASLIAGSSGETSAQLIAALNAAMVSTSTNSSNGLGPVQWTLQANGSYTASYQWAFTAGGNIYLNGNYFPDPTQQNIQLPGGGGMTSFLSVVNGSLNTSLNAQRLGTFAFLHELSHIADSGNANAGTIDSLTNNQNIASLCITNPQ
jgi:RHS repeat-associated protein